MKEFDFSVFRNVTIMGTEKEQVSALLQFLTQTLMVPVALSE
jgi:hypothetical protein